jgi:hypothetical protein
MAQKLWLKPAEAAPLLDLTNPQIWDKLRRNLLPPEIRVLKIGRQYRINAADVGLCAVITDNNQMAEASAEAA